MTVAPDRPPSVAILAQATLEMSDNTAYYWPSRAASAIVSTCGLVELKRSALVQVTDFTTCCSGIGSAEIGLDIIRKSLAIFDIRVTARGLSSQDTLSESTQREGGVRAPKS